MPHYIKANKILTKQHPTNSGEFLTSLVISVPLRGDEANEVHQGMNVIRPVKDIEGIRIEM